MFPFLSPVKSHVALGASSTTSGLLRSSGKVLLPSHKDSVDFQIFAKHENVGEFGGFETTCLLGNPSTLRWSEAGHAHHFR